MSDTKDRVIKRYQQAKARVDKTDGDLSELRAQFATAQRTARTCELNVVAREGEMRKDKEEVAFYADLLSALGFTDKEIKWEL